MAIYAQGWIRVRFVTARLVPIWVEHKPYETKWHYSEPKKIGKRSKVERDFVWHVTAEYDETKDGVTPGMKLYGGKEEPMYPSFRADDGINELIAECYRLNPADAERERQRYAA